MPTMATRRLVRGVIRAGQSRRSTKATQAFWISMPLGCAAATGSWQHGCANQSPHLVELVLSPLSEPPLGSSPALRVAARHKPEKGAHAHPHRRAQDRAPGNVRTQWSVRGTQCSSVNQARPECTPSAAILAGTLIRSGVMIEATITCPLCGHQARETMATNACQRFYLCGDCETILKPRPGDCCVFCSYANVVCPPRQQAP